MFDFGLFLDPRYCLLILSLALNAVGYTNIGTFAPLHLVVALEADGLTASVALSAFALADMVGRVVGPGVSDVCTG